MRYWTLSKILELTLNKENPDRHFGILTAVTWIGFSLILVICVMFSVLMYYGLTSNLIFVIPAFIWLITFSFLADALRRIKSVMKMLTQVIIIYEVFFLYAATACLAILGQVPVMVLAFLDAMRPRAYTIVTIANNIIIFVVQAFIIIIFNKLISVANEGKLRRTFGSLRAGSQVTAQVMDSDMISICKSDEVAEVDDECYSESRTDRSNTMKMSTSTLNQSIDIQVLTRHQRQSILSSLSAESRDVSNAISS